MTQEGRPSEVARADGDGSFLTWFICTRPTCNWRQKLVDSLASIELLLAAMVDVPGTTAAVAQESYAERLKHPSGAPALAIDLNRFLGESAKRRRST